MPCAASNSPRICRKYCLPKPEQLSIGWCGYPHTTDHYAGQIFHPLATVAGCPAITAGCPGIIADCLGTIINPSFPSKIAKHPKMVKKRSLPQLEVGVTRKNVTGTLRAMTTPPKGLPGALVANTAAFVNYQDGAVVSREIVRKPTGNATLFAFDEGQGLSEHTAPFDALVQVLEGEAEIMIAGQTYRVQGGEMILLPVGQVHALRAIKRFKMMLTMIRS